MGVHLCKEIARVAVAEMLSHPIESDGVSAQFFTMLAKENKKDMQSCRVNCPPTVLFEQGFAKAAFATESSKPGDAIGELKRKPGKEVDLQELYHSFARNALDGDICAVLLFAPPRVNEMNNVRFMDKNDLRHFLFNEIEKPRSLLQKFVKPKGVSNTLIHAVWSPLMVLAEGRRNAHSLKDRHLPPAIRGATFETNGSGTVEVVVAQAVVKEITATCKTVAEHFEKTERMSLNRLAAFFKVDEKNNLQLLFSTSIRVQDTVTGKNYAPVNLALAVSAPTTTVDRQTDEDKFLEETDKRASTFRVTIPSMPDTSSLLLHSIHSSVREFRSPSPVRRQRALQAATTPQPQQARVHVKPASPKSVVRASALSPESATPSRSHPRADLLAQSPRAPHAAQSPHATSSTAAPRHERELVLSPGAALPQPRQLLKFQHILPNSSANMTTAQRRVELGTTEAESKAEWDAFMVQQQHQVALLRTQEAEQKSSVKYVHPEGADRRTQGTRESHAAPPVKNATTFRDGESAVTVAYGADTGKPETGGHVPSSDLSAFMKSYKQAHGDDASGRHSTVEGVSSPPRSAVTQVPPAHTVGDARALPALRRSEVPMPLNSRVPRSVLLPPAFAQSVERVTPKKAASRRGPPVAADRTPEQVVERVSTHTPPSRSENVCKPRVDDAAGSKKLNHVTLRTAESRKRSLPPAPLTPSKSPALSPVQASTTTPSPARSDALSLLLSRSKAPRRADALSQGLSCDALDAVMQRALRVCSDFKQYVNELHYALYCFFLGAPAAEAYIELPERFQCCAPPAVMAKMLHKLHVRVSTARTELVRMAAAVEPMQTRSRLVDLLHNGALSEFMPPDVDAAGLDSTACLIVPCFERRFLVLRGESTSFAEGELEEYLSAPDGVVFDAAYRHELIAYVAEMEGAQAVLERLEQEQNLVNHVADNDTQSAVVDDDATSSRSRSLSTTMSASHAASMREASTRASDAYCTRCQTCAMCCVCALVFSRRR